VQVSRLLGGPRKVIKISEVAGMEGDNFMMHDVFVFKQTGVDQKRKAQGHFLATGIRPNCLGRLAALGAGVPPEMFEQRTLSLDVS
jgi:pilus assembly protein CpaF